MRRDPPDLLSRESIGIIGCGHLGRALAYGLVSRGFPLDRLMLSRGKSESSLHRIIDVGLGDCLAENEEICRECDIIFISIRPQSLPELVGLAFPKDALVVSCMAGVSLQAIRRLLGVDAVRMMPSGPDTIEQKWGIAAIFPKDESLGRILRCLDIRVFELSEEEQMHVFTVGICLPAALLASDECEDAREKACRSLSRVYPDFPMICSWARDVLPTFESEEDKRDYISRMATKGGITEAIVQGLRNDGDLLTALRQGITRSREISLRYEVH
ncbi:MAG: pyrroline-5-carboxylate reductase family protein [Methanothrix sp.]